MICKWCGATADVTKGICTSCGKELPPLSDCGGFYDIVPDAAKRSSAPEPTAQEWNAVPLNAEQRNPTQPFDAPAMPMQGEPQVVQIRPRSGGRVLFVIPIVLLLVAVLVVSLLLVSANRENDDLTEKIEKLAEDNDELNEKIDKLRDERNDDRNDDGNGTTDISENGDKTTTEAPEPAETTAEPVETTTEPTESSGDDEPDDEDQTPDFSEEALSFTVDLRDIVQFESPDVDEYRFEVADGKEKNEYNISVQYIDIEIWNLTLDSIEALSKGDALKITYDLMNEEGVNFGTFQSSEFKWYYRTNNIDRWNKIDSNDITSSGNTCSYDVSDNFLSKLQGKDSCTFKCEITRESAEGGKLTITVIWSVPLATTNT